MTTVNISGFIYRKSWKLGIGLKRISTRDNNHIQNTCSAMQIDSKSLANIPQWFDGIDFAEIKLEIIVVYAIYFGHPSANGLVQQVLRCCHITQKQNVSVKSAINKAVQYSFLCFSLSGFLLKLSLT